MSNITRTTEGLRDHLFQLMDDLRAGNVTPQDARTQASLAQQVHNTIKVELEAARFVSEQRQAKEEKPVTHIPAVRLGGE